MHRCDSVQEIACPYKIKVHSVPSDPEMQQPAAAQQHNVPLFFHHRQTQALKLFCFEIHHSNNKANQNWNLFLPATFLQLEVQRFADRYTCREKVHAIDRDHAASRTIAFAPCSNQDQQHCECLKH